MNATNKETERFEHFSHAVRWVMEKRGCTNQEATWFVHDNKFSVGTDRAIWITV